MKKEFRSFNLLGATGQMRMETFQGKKHTVVPVIALVEGVVRPANADGPELVQAEAFSRAPGGWNGRPVLLNHPKDTDNKYRSANDPRVLESSAFGQIFNADVKDGALVYEAWMDPERATAVGEKAVKILERVSKNEIVEVSVGAFVGYDETPGVFEGKKFDRKWVEVTPDHHAMLEEGLVGACSNDMGCGAPRVMTNFLSNRKIISLVSEADPATTTAETFVPLLTRIKQALRLNVDPKGPSTHDMFRAINRALRAEEPGFLGIEDVWPDDGVVVYAVMPENEIILFRRKFTLDAGAEKATLNSRKEKV